MTGSTQYLRKVSLLVADDQGEGLDLSQLRIQFTIKKTSTETPNSAIVRVYNLPDSIVNKIKKEFTNVTLQAGYESNFGVIFKGNIKQSRDGRENSTDTYLDLACGDGDKAYNFSIVNTTLAAGATQLDQINAASAPMEANGVKKGYTEIKDLNELPRGKVMFGMSRAYLSQATEASDTTYSIQDSKIQVLPRTASLPDSATVLTSKTGLIGTPEQTEDGISARALLNPLIKINAVVRIGQADVAAVKLQDTETGDQVNAAPGASVDGQYRVISATYLGDNFGRDWYTDIICLAVDATAARDEGVSQQ